MQREIQQTEKRVSHSHYNVSQYKYSDYIILIALVRLYIPRKVSSNKLVSNIFTIVFPIIWVYDQ